MLWVHVWHTRTDILVLRLEACLPWHQWGQSCFYFVLIINQTWGHWSQSFGLQVAARMFWVTLWTSKHIYKCSYPELSVYKWYNVTRVNIPFHGLCLSVIQWLLCCIYCLFYLHVLHCCVWCNFCYGSILLCSLHDSLTFAFFFFLFFQLCIFLYLLHSQLTPLPTSLSHSLPPPLSHSICSASVYIWAWLVAGLLTYHLLGPLTLPLFSLLPTFTSCSSITNVVTQAWLHVPIDFFL